MKHFNNIFRSYKNIIGILFILVTASSCHYHEAGQSGKPGVAYLALSYDYIEPLYIEAGTSAIPSIFEWDIFYIANTGFYQTYFDGEYWNGLYWEEYAWEMEYEIWINLGEEGDYHYDGRDGADTYFTVVMNPYGPYMVEENQYRSAKSNDKTKKALELNKKYQLISESETEIKVQEKTESHTIQITFKKVEKRER